MRLTERYIWSFILIILPLAFYACGSGDDSLPPEGSNDKDKGEQPEVIVNPVTDLKAVETQKANELQLTWQNPSEAISVEISYLSDGDNETNAISTNVRVNGNITGSLLIKVPKYNTYRISAIATDNYGRHSKKTTITAKPAEKDAEVSWEIVEDKLPIADPYILYHNDKYYAYGTRINGFEVYISEDLKHWKRGERLALSPENSWGDKWYWAPEVYYVASKNMFYMFYTVNEHICVATSTSPEGPFVQSEKKPIVANEKGIDTSFFMDDNGTPYLYFVRFTGGNVIWVAEMNKDLKSIKTETLKQCISAENPWEKKQGTITEGPSLIKRGNTYYLLYSANHYESQDYAVGYATSDSPLGPWKKYSGNPILRRDKAAADGLVGTGHGAPFVCKDGSYKYIFHAHASSTSIGPRTSYINDLHFSDDGIISISGKLIKPVIVKQKVSVLNIIQ